MEGGSTIYDRRTKPLLHTRKKYLSFDFVFILCTCTQTCVCVCVVCVCVCLCVSVSMSCVCVCASVCLCGVCLCVPILSRRIWKFWLNVLVSWYFLKIKFMKKKKESFYWIGTSVNQMPAMRQASGLFSSHSLEHCTDALHRLSSDQVGKKIKRKWFLKWTKTL